MSLFVMADLHLDIKSNEKSMEVFGKRWTNYVNKIEKNWNRVVSDDDTVIIPGDICWALNLKDAIIDLQWIDRRLNGQKILLKGNHDFWWATTSKIEKTFDEHSINTIRILNNNAYEIEDHIICGSRGWFTDSTMQTVAQSVDYQKIINRETIRLRLSLEEAKKIRKDNNKEIIVFLHFPPIWGEFQCNEILAILEEYDIKQCYFGHIHSNYNIPQSYSFKNIKFTLISADYLDFIPQIIA